MRLGAPAFLWLLLALPIIVLLYMLRARRQEVLISSVLLWQRARQDLQARLPIRRLERNLLLLLQLLAALCAILAVAQPHLPLPATRGAATVIVLDTSVSMQATDVVPSRFEVAKQQAQARAASVGGPVMVIEAGPRPQILVPFGDRRDAQQALTRLRPTDAPGRLDDAVELARAQQAPQGQLQVVVFTDHAATQLPGVTYRIIGSSSRNLAIVGLHTQPVADGTHVVVQVKNFGDARERVPVVLSLDGRRALERVVFVGPASVTTVTGTVPGQGILKAEILVDDPLKADNVAYGILGAPLARVVVLGEEDRVLDQALAALPVRYTPTRQVTAEAFAGADVVILNRIAPVTLPPGNFLLLGTTATNLPLTTNGLAYGPQILRWSHRHPVMRYVDLNGVLIQEALELRPTGGEVLAEGEGPLIWDYDGGGIRAIVVAFPIDRSDLPLKVAYPIFLTNAINWLAGSDSVYHAGDPLIQSAGGAVDAMLVDPSGAQSILRATDGRFVIPSLNRIGVYVLRVGEHVRRFVVNPAPEGSAIAPVGSNQTVAQLPVVQERTVPMWPIFLGGALVFLVAEWVMWVRGLPRTDLGRPRVNARR